MAVSDVILFKKKIPAKANDFFLKIILILRLNVLRSPEMLCCSSLHDSSACCFVIAVMAFAALLKWVPQSDGSYGSN